MAPEGLGALALVALGAAAATALLARAAPRLGLVDGAVPAVGGLAVSFAAACAWSLGAGFDAGALWCAPGDALLALAAALALGVLDDALPRGLSPAAKLLFEALALAPLWSSLAEGLGLSAPVALAALALALLAWNAFAIFDNADGTAGGTALAGLAGPAPLVAAALAGFLPFNLLRRRGSAAPRAYLGNAGSHVLGLALVLVPAAWPVLALPFLDAARVALERLRAGRAPWTRDRRHLAHRLARRGDGPVSVCLQLTAAACPAAVLGTVAARAPQDDLAAGWLVAGAAAGALGFTWLSTRARAGRRAA